TDYIKFARARGLTQRAVNFGHALKNTLVPVITVIGLQLGAVIAFAIITETVFQWPGMGLMFIQAVQNADIPVMAAYLLLVAFLFVMINFLVDLIYVRVDPRIRIYGRGVGGAMQDTADKRAPTTARPESSKAALALPHNPVGPTRWQRWRDSDLLHSFLRSKLVVLAAIVTVFLVGAAFLAPVIAPHNPYDLKSL